MQSRIDESWFESLFAREYRGVVAAAARIVGPSAAEDAAQEAFAELYRSGPFAPAHARNRVYLAALHRALSALRGDRRRLARETAVAPRLHDVASEPQAAVERDELRRTVRTALSHIRPRYAAVLALRHSGLSHREISQILDLKLNQVGTTLVRAEAALKKELDRVPSL
jgi:RNA polymerase sigma-70 factor (ECF subfamily)